MAEAVFPMFPTTGVGSANSTANRYSQAFPDPFFDYASTQMPRSLYDVMRWCEYLWVTNGTFRMAAQRVVRYFLTKIELQDASDDEKEKYEDFLNKQIKILDVLATIGDDYMCFHGDTEAVTRGGVFKLRELVGKTVDVLSKDGVYRPAEFKSFGHQELLEVEFSDGRTVLATPEHRWIAKNCSDKEVEVSTAELRKGYRIPRVVAPRPERGDDFKEGVRHGFTFGDGSLYNKGKQAKATFFGEKDAVMLAYWDVDDYTPDSGKVEMFGLPPHYKALPSNDMSAEYWYGFVCGFLSADGTVDTHGCAMLTQASSATLEAIVRQLPRIGMSAGPVRSQRRTAEFVRDDGHVDVYDSDIYYVTLLKQSMLPQDFLIPAHRAKFEENYKPTNYGQYIGVKEVRGTGIVDEVFCCVEMETHTFVIDNGILTKQCYGNSFTSVHIPFRRYLRCRKCFHERTLGRMEYSFENWQFNATCPQCGWTGVFERVDRRSVEEDKPRIIRWSPHEVRLQHHPISHETAYYWIPPSDIKREVRKGNPFYLESTPWEIVECLRTDKWFQFNKGIIYHFKEECVAGLRNAGWGIPRILANFKQAWYVQVLKRYNEAIGLDYIIPFRIITPGKGSGTGEVDPLYHVNAGSFMGRVMGMIRKHRKDPTQWNALPFPIDYRALGGEGQDLAPVDLINAGMDEFLNAMGVPAEMYRGTLQVQAAPMALRLFERTWTHFVSAMNGWVNWFFEAITDLMNWEKISGRLQPTTLAEDIEKKQIQLQLAASQQISKQTAFAPYGIDWREEIRRMFEEEKQFADESKKFQEDQAKQQEFEQIFAAADQPQMPGQPAPAGGAPAGAAPAGQPSPAGGTTPDDMQSQAEQIAMQMLGMPYEIRKSQLTDLKKSDQTLHALVIQKMDETRDQAKLEGGFQALQQMTGAQTG